MSKKQLLFLALVAAIPATGLLVKLLFSLLHLLSDQSSASAVLWVIYVVCLLGSAFFSTLPLWLWLYYPAAGFEGAGAPVGAMPDSRNAIGGKSPVFDDEDASEEEEYADDEDAVEDDGEKLFDEDAMEDDFDEFEGGFDDDEK